MIWFLATIFLYDCTAAFHSICFYHRSSSLSLVNSKRLGLFPDPSKHSMSFLWEFNSLTFQKVLNNGCIVIFLQIFWMFLQFLCVYLAFFYFSNLLIYSLVFIYITTQINFYLPTPVIASKNRLLCGYHIVYV